MGDFIINNNVIIGLVPLAYSKDNYGLNIICVTYDKIINITKKNKYTQNINKNYSVVIDDANLDSISKILQN